MATASQRTVESEVSIFARFFDDESGRMPEERARQILGIQVSDRDRSRMRELADRNQDGTLSEAEREEMVAFAKVTTLLSILKSKARLALGVKVERRSKS